MWLGSPGLAPRCPTSRGHPSQDPQGLPSYPRRPHRPAGGPFVGTLANFAFDRKHGAGWASGVGYAGPGPPAQGPCWPPSRAPRQAGGAGEAARPWLCAEDKDMLLGQL